jgi:S1-C subfamily serine protease
MTVADWVILGLLVLLAIHGFGRGFVATALSLVGFIAGAVLGSRIAPLLLAQGDRSPYAALFALVGALLLGSAVAMLCEAFANKLRGLMIFPGMRFADGLAGAVLGALIGLMIAWIAGAVVLQNNENNLLPKSVASSIRSSVILKQLDEILPPSSSLLNDLARIDPLPALDGDVGQISKPDARIVATVGVSRASNSVVRITGSACGLGIEGSGWVAAPHTIVTNAHVVAGESQTYVQPDGRGPAYSAQVIGFDPHNDIAVLHVSGIYLRSLSLAAGTPSGESAAILGYPENGPFNVQAARLGPTQQLAIQNAYGNPTVRDILTIRGLVRPGNSGGPLIDGDGQVVGTVFAEITNAAKGRPGGYAVPNSVVSQELSAALHDPHQVSTEGCAE